MLEVLMMIELIINASSAIILGYLFNWFSLINKSSHNVNERDSCDSTDKFSCLKCDKSKHRVLSEEAPS